MSSRYDVTAGRPTPLGATPDENGTNFAVFSANATAMTLCLFDESGFETRLDLPEHRGEIWHGHVAGVRPGQVYGYRAHGPFRPEDGHRFNSNKLLLDPYSRQVTGQPQWHDALYERGKKSADRRDSAPYAPRSIVTALTENTVEDRPNTPLDQTVIYEAHLKGLTMQHPGIAEPGTTEAAASDKIIEHLLKLGITAVEFLPLQYFANDHFLVKKGLVNYWGYQPLGYFAPDPRYLPGGDIAAIRRMVDRFHTAGIEVILDVVYNHTGEGDHTGPTLSFRGLDNASYYRLMPDDARLYVNDTGTGNTLRTAHPMVMRMVLDSLRYWVTTMGVDGFRFDLGASLARMPYGFDRNAPILQAMRQDPILAETKLIMEPWDIGPGGYQLGAFTPPFLSWNDKYRDGDRRFWRGAQGTAPDFASRITGSALQFDHSGRRATSSLNFLTAHDGFTLEDTVSFSRRYNAANKEGGKDGHSENYSDNLGVEGPTDDQAILRARARRKRNMMATLLLSQGTPMMRSVDVFGISQGGNINAYNQDNPTGWIDWTGKDSAFQAFVERLIAFRRAHPIVRQSRFLHSQARPDGLVDLFWRRVDGTPMADGDWQNPGLKTVCVEMRTASGTPAYDDVEYAIFAVFNAGISVTVRTPDPPPGQVWCLEIDSADPDATHRLRKDRALNVAAESVAVLVLEPQGA